MKKVALSCTYISNISLSNVDPSYKNTSIGETTYFDLEESDMVKVTFLSGNKKTMTVKEYLEYTHNIEYTSNPITGFKPLK